MAYPSGNLLPTNEVNREQHTYWAGDGPRQYQQYGDRWEAMFAPFGQAMLDAAQLQVREAVLDVGCGHGTSTIEAARRVASGRVVGVDISTAMLEPARQRVTAAGLDNVELLRADAQVHPFQAASFDTVISRFGMTFFDSPDAAFANLASALRPTGRMTFVCWQDPLKSQWIAVALNAVLPLLGRVPDLSAPGAPGPFAFADGDLLTRMISAGGFRDVVLNAVTRPQNIGADAADAAGFVMAQIGRAHV